MVEDAPIPVGATGRFGGGRMSKRTQDRRKREQLEEGRRRSADRAEVTRQRREDARARAKSEEDALLQAPLTAQERAERDAIVDRQMQAIELQLVQHYAALGPQASNREAVAALRAIGMTPSLQAVQDSVEAAIRLNRLPHTRVTGGTSLRPLSKKDARAAGGKDIVAGAPLATPVASRRKGEQEWDEEAKRKQEFFDMRDAGWAERPPTVEDPVTGRRVVDSPTAAKLRAIAARHMRTPAPGEHRAGQAHLADTTTIGPDGMPRSDIIPATPSREKPRARRDRLDSDEVDMETVNPPSPDLGGLPRGISAETRDLPDTFNGGDPGEAAIDTAINGPRLQDVERRPAGWQP